MIATKIEPVILAQSTHKKDHALFTWWSDGKVTRQERRIWIRGYRNFGPECKVKYIDWNNSDFFALVKMPAHPEYEKR